MKHLRRFENFYLPEEDNEEEIDDKDIDETDELDDLTPEGDDN